MIPYCDAAVQKNEIHLYASAWKDQEIILLDVKHKLPYKTFPFLLKSETTLR